MKKNSSLTTLGIQTDYLRTHFKIDSFFSTLSVNTTLTDLYIENWYEKFTSSLDESDDEYYDSDSD